MPRRAWTRPFPEVRQAIVGVLNDGAARTSSDIVTETGLPLEDVISALRLLRHMGELDFDPEWEAADRMSGARNVRLSGRQRSSQDEGESRQG